MLLLLQLGGRLSDRISQLMVLVRLIDSIAIDNKIRLVSRLRVDFGLLRYELVYVRLIALPQAGWSGCWQNRRHGAGSCHSLVQLGFLGFLFSLYAFSAHELILIILLAAVDK